MKLPTAVILGIAGVALASAVIIRSVQPHFDVTIGLGGNGINSLKCRDIEFIENGEFRLNQVTLKKLGGETYPGATYGPAQVDQAHRELTRTFPWGKVKVTYASSGNQLKLNILTTNTSDTDTIQGLLYQPLTIRFPEKVKEYDGSIPLLAHNVGEIGVVKASFGSGSVAVVSEDIDKPLMVGFPWANDRPANKVFPLSVNTDRVASYPDSFPAMHRPIPPKGTDQYNVTMRFGPSNASEIELAGDIYKRFGETFPNQLKWPDHRPIGVIFLATSQQSWTTNPRGWLIDSQLNVLTSSGRSAFRQRILALADTSISIMKDMNAQGAITWDIEGQQYAHAVSYVGDPRAVDELAPEMKEVVAEYFSRFRNAGLRVGVCVRPQQLTISPDKKTGKQTLVADPGKLLIDKIAYAKKRWGVTLFYVDSNINSSDPNPMDASVLRKVATEFPDVLLIPEHSTLQYYAFSAPFAELRQGHVSTPDAARAAYPNAFTFIYTADGPLDIYHKSLAAAVKRGDGLMFRTWYADPQNEKVKGLLKR